MFNFFQNLFKASLTLSYSPPDPNGIPPDYGNLDAFLRGKKVGSATFWAANGQVFNLDRIDVFNEARGKGYGTKMLQHLIHEARELKCTKFVFQGVDNSNMRAISLYQRLGAQRGASRGTTKHDYEITPL